MPYGRRKTTTRRRSANTGYRRRTPYKARGTSKKSRYQRPKNVGPSRALRPKWLNPVAAKQLVKFTYCDSGFQEPFRSSGATGIPTSSAGTASMIRITPAQAVSPTDTTSTSTQLASLITELQRLQFASISAQKAPTLPCVGSTQ